MQGPDEVIRELAKHPIWRAELGYGTVLRIDAGDKIPHVLRNGKWIQRGYFHLMVYACEWALVEGVMVLLDSANVDRPLADAILQRVLSTTITEVGFLDRLATIRFSNGLSLTMRPYSDQAPDDAYFILYAGDVVVGCTLSGLYLKKPKSPKGPDRG